MTATARRRAVRGSLLAVIALLFAAAVYTITTNTPTRDSIYPKCFMHSATGLHCPGCGTGRAAHFALNGQFLTAARYNVFALFALPIVLVAAARSLVRWALDRPAPRHRPVRALWIWLLFAWLVAFTVVRNIPHEPFARLAPQEVPEVNADAK